MLIGTKKALAVAIRNNKPQLRFTLLSERLKDLEEEGIVKRDVYPETPVRIEYSLTKKGYSLEPLMKDIEKWSQEWIEKE